MPASQTSPAALLTRKRWVIEGCVQGVGFRPFICRLARELHLAGFVQNRGGAVVVECEGPAADLERFALQLRTQSPPSARIQRVREETLFTTADSEFCIHTSSAQRAGRQHRVAPDTALCPDCRAELVDPANRRHRHPLITCTTCGPRYSILERIPYDRQNTTMAGFEMCGDCIDEYRTISDRRFHAQPICCPDCGPTLQLVAPARELIDEDPIQGALRRLEQGQIVAIKGLGAFHLAVRADDEQAVLRLRQLKRRDQKPFALMCRDVETARRLVDLSPAGLAELTSPAAPIVLAERRADAPVATAVAPGTHRLGVMLPNTAIHHLLFTGALDVLVMTSANESNQPLIISNTDARLAGLCDAILWHDRPIRRGIDDSVILDTAPLTPIRRARGYVPDPVTLPIRFASNGIAVGGELKNTIAVMRAGEAILSQHLGDLTQARSLESFRTTIEDLSNLFDVAPQWIAHDLHPMYLSTAVAREIAALREVPTIAVQHHHAHAAALLAEHNLTGPILAIVCDGVGYGDDGHAWGGELLLADLVDYRRLAHVRPLRLPGGDAAAKETARCALALLYQAYGDAFAAHPITHLLVPDATRRDMLCRMIAGDVACVRSTSVGRMFDGAAALLGLCDRNQHEAQAAMALESAAHSAGAVWSTDETFELTEDAGRIVIDLSRFTRTLLRAHAGGCPAGSLAQLFHSTLAQAWDAAVGAVIESTGVKTVGLTGGVFCNARLATELTTLLEQRGLRVLRHQIVPPNDGGLSLGQAAVAAARRERA